MKLFTIIILLLNCCVTCTAQNPSKSLKSDIIKFYININELQREDKQELLKDFDRLFTITNLNDTSVKYSNNTAGLYKISPNISHTTSNLLICNDGANYMVLQAIDNYKDVFSKTISFIKERNEMDKKEAIQYIESLLRLIKENEEIKNINTLEFKEN